MIDRLLLILTAIICTFGVGILVMLLAGCAAATTAAGFIASGGTTIYKSARETGPKVELVIFKFEANHTVVAPNGK